MRLVEALQIAGAILGSAASLFTVIEKRLVRRFRRAGATAPEHAVEIPPLGLPSRWRLSRLRSLRAVREVDDRTSYLDEATYAVIRRKRAVAGVSLVVAALALVVLLHSALS